MPFYKLIARREHLNLQAGIRSFEIPHEPRSQTRRQRNRLQRS
jgi:hypothetical protein